MGEKYFVERQRCRTHIHRPNGSWNDVADLMIKKEMINVSERRTSSVQRNKCVVRGALKSKGGG